MSEGEHERARGLFAPALLESGEPVDVLLAPFQFRCTPLQLRSGAPALAGAPFREVTP